MQRSLIAGVGLAIAIGAGPALAADLPVYKAPPSAPPAFSWSGCFIGGNAGGAWSKADVTWTPNPAGFPVSGPAIASQTAGSINASGFTGGVEYGCNYQFGSLVVGTESDFEYTGLSGSNTGAVAVAGTTNPFTQNFTSNWLSTSRGRIGIANGQWLFYVTGGLASARVSYSDAIFFPGTGTFNAASASETRWGGVVGGGVEWAFARNWSIKVDYLWVDLGSTSFTSINSNPVAFPVSVIQHDHRLTEQLARIGVHYKLDWLPFPWAPAPVVSKY